MAAILVTVAIVEGSGPREPGAKMLVRADALEGTVGGGHLELRAIDIARAMLMDGRERHLERFALGPSLGQCCGGVVHLAFEAIEAMPVEPGWRLVALDGEAERIVSQLRPALARDGTTHVVTEQDGRRWLVDVLAAPRAHLVLFGAGHVGAAIVRALAGLPCSVTWVDERDDMFPPTVPANVTVEATDVPEAVVAAAPAGASFLVMTHSHALDQRLAEAIMQRPDAGWFGLIGSHTKRKQFEHRLRAKGADPARIAAMACPIGVAGISNKAPAVIAASVCAQLLGVWEAEQAVQQQPKLTLVAARGG
jgi:xanthine dehydrogenase accessory factor